MQSTHSASYKVGRLYRFPLLLAFCISLTCGGCHSKDPHLNAYGQGVRAASDCCISALLNDGAHLLGRPFSVDYRLASLAEDVSISIKHDGDLHVLYISESYLSMELGGTGKSAVVSNVNVIATVFKGGVEGEGVKLRGMGPLHVGNSLGGTASWTFVLPDLTRQMLPAWVYIEIRHAKWTEQGWLPVCGWGCNERIEGAGLNDVASTLGAFRNQSAEHWKDSDVVLNIASCSYQLEVDQLAIQVYADYAAEQDRVLMTFDVNSLPTRMHDSVKMTFWLLSNVSDEALFHRAFDHWTGSDDTVLTVDRASTTIVLIAMRDQQDRSIAIAVPVY